MPTLNIDSVAQAPAGGWTSPDIADNAVTTAKIAATAVTTAKIAASAITPTELAAAAVTTAKIAASAVTANELGAAAVTTAKIAASAVTSNELGAAAVTTAKIAASAVTANEIAAAAVTTTKVADNAIDPSKVTKSVRRTPYLTNANEATATTEAEIKNFSFNKTASGASSWSDFAIAAQIKTSSAAQAATLLVYIDAEGTARATVTTTATAYDVQATLDIAISDLTTGNHTVKIKLKSADGVATASNKKLDFFLVADTTA